MEIEELIIDNEPLNEASEKSSVLKAVQCFRKGEWKKALKLAGKAFKDLRVGVKDMVDVYEAGIDLACKIINAGNAKLGIHIGKSLNKEIPLEDVGLFMPFQCSLLNCLACAFKQGQKLYSAKKYIDKAMKIVSDFQDISWEKSSTYLNMCAVLSAMGKHSEACQYAKDAINLVKEEMVELKFHQEPEKVKKKAAVLSIAYHNYAVEEEHLGNFNISLDFYKKAFQFLEKNDPDNKEMIEKFKDSYSDMKGKIFRKSRPSSAKSAYSQVTIKSFKSAKAINHPMRPNHENPKILKSRPKEVKKSETNLKDFLDFKSECRNFLVKDFTWLKSETKPDKNLENLKNLKNQEKNPKPLQTDLPRSSNNIKTLFTPSKLEVISAPVKGIENIRKPVFHDIDFGRPPRSPRSFQPDDLAPAHHPAKDQKDVKEAKQPPRPSTVTKRKSKVSLDFHYPEVEKFEDFEEVKASNQQSIKLLPQSSILKAGSSASPVAPANAPEAKEAKEAREAKEALKAKEDKENFREEFNSASQELAREKEKLVKRKKFDANDLKLICKIQARIRGMIAREKFRIMKFKPEILFRGAKRIAGTRYFVTILRKGDSKIVKINDGHEDIVWTTSQNCPPEEIFKRLDKSEKGFYLKHSEPASKPELLRSCKLKFPDDSYKVKYFFDWQSKTLKIEATKFSNSKVYSTEKQNLAFNSKPLIIRYINDEIQPNLCVKDQKLLIDKVKEVVEREFLVKGSRIFYNKRVYFTVFKVEVEDGLSIEVVAESLGLPVSFKISEFFKISDVTRYMEMFGVKGIEEDPHLVLLTFHIQDNKIVLRRLDKNWLKLVYDENNFYSGNEFKVKVYKVQDDACSFFFQVFGTKAPRVDSYSISDKDLADKFQLPVKKVEQSLNRVAKSIVIKNGAIELNSSFLKSESSFVREARIIIKIQSYIRGYLTRDRLRLQGGKNPLIYSMNRMFEDNPCLINFYKLGAGILIESLFGDLKRSYYLFLQRPDLYFSRFSRLYDIKCICNTIVFNMTTFLLPTLSGNVPFSICNFFAIEELAKYPNYPVIRTKLNTVSDHVLMIRELESKSIVVKLLRLTSEPDCIHSLFTKEAMQEVVGNANFIQKFLSKIDVVNGRILVAKDEPVKKAESLRATPRVTFRSIKLFDAKLYQVVMTVENNEKMNFVFRQGSEIDSEQLVVVDKQTACKLSGFSQEFLIPMADFMVKRMFAMEKDKIVLVPPERQFDMSKTLLKIQAFIRGFITRKALKLRMHFRIVFVTSAKIDNVMYKVLFYYCREDYSVALVKFPVVLTCKLNKKLMKDNESRIEKAIISKILPKIRIKDKDGKKKITGLQEWKKKNLAYVNVFEGTLSPSPMVTNRSRGSVMSRLSEDPGKVMKWRSKRVISDVECIVSIFEIANSGLIEAVIQSTGHTLKLEVRLELIKDPEILSGLLEIKSGKLLLRNESLNVVLTDKRFVSNRLAEISIFLTDKGYFATAFLVEENKSLNIFIGTDVDPQDAIKSLRIKDIMGQDVLMLSS